MKASLLSGGSPSSSSDKKAAGSLLKAPGNGGIVVCGWFYDSVLISFGILFLLAIGACVECTNGMNLPMLAWLVILATMCVFFIFAAFRSSFLYWKIQKLGGTASELVSLNNKSGTASNLYNTMKFTKAVVFYYVSLLPFAMLLLQESIFVYWYAQVKSYDADQSFPTSSLMPYTLAHKAEVFRLIKIASAISFYGLWGVLTTQSPSKN